MALLENQLQQTNEMRVHRMRRTSKRDLEEWINIMNRTIDSLEKELIQREEQALQVEETTLKEPAETIAKGKT